jgi:hypothetical protein
MTSFPTHSCAVQPVLPFITPPNTNESLFLPRRSRQVPPEAWQIFPADIPAQWHGFANDKGFEIVRRVRDKNHIVLECQTCGGMTAHKVYTLRSARPDCAACQYDRIIETAKAAGLIFLGYHPTDRHQGFFRAPCGHELIRQFEFIERCAIGDASPRCETCHAAKEQEEAAARGWELSGPDPEGHQNYRLYRHDCGHEQRVARTNMQTGRFCCEECGEGWSSAPSYIYAMRFVFPDGTQVVKLGFSRDPQSRLHYQLKRSAGAKSAGTNSSEIDGELLRQVPMQSGHLALCVEKRLHAEIKRTYPGAALPVERFDTWLRVKSEIYVAELEPVILAMLRRLHGDARDLD